MCVRFCLLLLNPRVHALYFTYHWFRFHKYLKDDISLLFNFLVAVAVRYINDIIRQLNHALLVTFRFRDDKLKEISQNIIPRNKGVVMYGIGRNYGNFVSNPRHMVVDFLVWGTRGVKE